MTKSELTRRLSLQLVQHPLDDIEVAVNVLLEQLTEQLAAGGCIEIRGFGAFSIHHHAARMARNPRTGASINVPDRYAPHFTPGIALRERVTTTKGR
jgi:integration host factor subunit beta